MQSRLGDPKGVTQINMDTSDPLQAAGETALGNVVSKGGLAATVGILAGLGAASCCVVPFALFSLGITGAWISNITALAPYQPIFAAVAFGCIGYGSYHVYWKRKKADTVGTACASPVSGRIVKGTLWGATLLIVLALTFPYFAPIIFDV